MRYTLLLVFFLSFSIVAGSSAPHYKRKIPCRTPQNASSCYWTRGRLSFYNGTPSYRMWKISTHRLLGIYSGPAVNIRNDNEDNEHPEFPKNVQDKFRPIENRLYADYEICPLERERTGWMQAVCIESAKNIVVEKTGASISTKP